MPREPKYLTPKQLTERWGTYTVQSLANRRHRKEGPPYVKIGSKVLYPIAELELWEAENRRLFHANDNNEADAAKGAA